MKAFVLVDTALIENWGILSRRIEATYVWTVAKIDSWVTRLCMRPLQNPIDCVVFGPNFSQVSILSESFFFTTHHNKFLDQDRR